MNDDSVTMRSYKYIYTCKIPFCPAYLSLAAKDSPPPPPDDDDEYEPALPSFFAEPVEALMLLLLRYIDVEGVSLSAIKAATRPDIIIIRYD